MSSEAKSKCGLLLPTKLTAEEKALKHKYKELRKLKQKLELFESRKVKTEEKSESSANQPVGNQDKAKKVAKEVMKVSQSKVTSAKKDTKDFKKPSKQKDGRQVFEKRRALNEYGGDGVDQNRTIVIKSKGIDLEFIYKHFGPVGHIRKTNLPGNADIATVTFETEQSARTAVLTMDGTTVDGCLLSVSRIKRKNMSWTPAATAEGNSANRPPWADHYENTVFVKFKGVVGRKELHDLFAPLGGLVKVYTPNTANYGFVSFKTREAADNAVAKMDGMDYNGVPLLVGHAKKRFWDSKKPSGCSKSADPRGLISYE